MAKKEAPGPKCPQCGVITSGAAALTRHQVIAHGLGKPASKG